MDKLFWKLRCIESKFYNSTRLDHHQSVRDAPPLPQVIDPMFDTGNTNCVLIRDSVFFLNEQRFHIHVLCLHFLCNPKVYKLKCSVCQESGKPTTKNPKTILLRVATKTEEKWPLWTKMLNAFQYQEPVFLPKAKKLSNRFVFGVDLVHPCAGNDYRAGPSDQCGRRYIEKPGKSPAEIQTDSCIPRAPWRGQAYMSCAVDFLWLCQNGNVSDCSGTVKTLAILFVVEFATHTASVWIISRTQTSKPAGSSKRPSSGAQHVTRRC